MAQHFEIYCYTNRVRGKQHLLQLKSEPQNGHLCDYPGVCSYFLTDKIHMCDFKFQFSSDKIVFFISGTGTFLYLPNTRKIAV